MESQEAIATAAALEPPLFVDLDGTLVKTDLLLESFMAWIKQNPANVFVSLLWLAKGKAHFKSELAKRVDIPVHLLPYETGLLDFLKGEAVCNRAIYLATASDQKYANAVARHLGIFRGVVASDGQTNLKGAAKLAAIVRLCDGKQFDYAGDSAADTVIWRRARQAILVNPSRALSHGAPGLGNVVRVFGGRANLPHAAIKAMRIGQWPKNLLLFVPLLAGHMWRMDALAITCLGFVSFSLTASAT